MKKLYVLIFVGLLIGILYQAFYLFGEYGPDMIGIRTTLGKSGLWRGANFNQSQKVADFIEFLNSNIPENERVILPSFESDRKVLVNPYMQFFLAPREVANCVNIECVKEISREETNIVIVGKSLLGLFPDSSYIMFNDQWGVVPSENHATENLPQMESYKSLVEIIRAGVGPLIWMAGLTISGTILVRLILPEQERLFQIALGYGIGLGLLSFGITLFALLGFNINTVLIIVVTVSLLIGVLILYFWERRLKESVRSQHGSGKQNSKFDFWPLLFLGIGLIVIVLGVGKGYHRIDAIQIWGAKGYGVAADGSLENITKWGTNTLPYPLHIPVSIAAYRVLFGDELPSSKMVFGGYFLAIMLVGYYALLSMGVKRMLSGLAIMLVMTTPVIFRHGTIGYANLPLTFFLLSGVVVFLKVFMGRLSKWILLLSSVMFVCAAWTRPEGLMLAFLASGLLLLFVYIDKNITFGWQRILYFLVPLGLYTLFWQIVKAKIYPVPLSKNSLIKDALAKILQGEFHINEMFYVVNFLLEELVTLKVWGFFGVIMLIVTAVVLLFRNYISHISRVMIVTGGLFLSLIIAMYYIASYDSVNDLSWWVTSGLDRMIFPGVIVFWLGITYVFQDILEGSR